MHFRSSLITIFFLLAVAFVTAQEDYVVIEGATSYYSVDFHPGNNYQWEVVKQFNPTVYATSGDYDFVTGDDTNEVEIFWKKQGRFFILLNESDETGCTNAKALSVLVVENARSAGFELLTAESCFSGTGNSFELAVKTLNSAGQPLESQYYPLNVEFTVNGNSYTQQLSYNNPVIRISDRWFDVDPETETIIQIKNVTDNNSIPVQIRSAGKTFTYTWHLIPEVTFAANTPDTIYLNASCSFQAEYIPGYNYEWWFTDSTGTRTNFVSNTYSTEGLFWKTKGTFEIFVRASNENGCYSPVISKPLVVSDEIRIPQLVALPDFTMGYANTTITGNVATNDFLSPARSWNLVYSLAGESIPGLICNPDGSYIFMPEKDFTGQVSFTYQVCFEDPSLGCATSEAVIQVISDNNEENIAPIAVTDIVLTFPNQRAVGNVLLNDVDPDGNSELLTLALLPVTDPFYGEVEIAEDGSFLYTPETDFEGSDRFLYRICDNGTPSLCDSGWVYVVVNDFESGSSKPVSTSEDVFIRNKDTLIFAGNDTTIGSCNPYVLDGSKLEGEGYSYLWQPAENLDDPSSANPVFTPGNTTRFYLSVTNSNGFFAKDSVTITVADVIAEAGDDLFLLLNSTTVLDGSNSTGIGLSFNWTTESGFIESGANTPNPVVTQPGTYYLRVTDTFGCSSTDSVNVGVLAHVPLANDDYDSTSYRTEVKIPVLNNDSDPDNNIDSLSLAISSAPFNGIAYVDYDDFTVHYRPDNNFSGTDYFEYRICDFTGNCDEAKVTVWVSDLQFFIPDAFSPNGDNINDYFEIPGIEYYDGNSIEIYNRWGNKVYEAKNYGIATVPKYWNGKSNTGFRLGNEELPSGTYFYVINLGNGEKRMAGSVYLDR
jgi:gliding motility-associated-like protein